MASKSKTYAFRLHPNDQRESDAMDIIDALQGEGYTLREIMTDAILRARGHKPEMYKNTDDSVSRGFIEIQLEGFAHHIISELRANGMVVSAQEPEERSPFGVDEDEEMAQNLAQGFLARRKRGS